MARVGNSPCWTVASERAWLANELSRARRMGLVGPANNPVWPPYEQGLQRSMLKYVCAFPILSLPNSLHLSRWWGMVGQLPPPQRCP